MIKAGHLKPANRSRPSSRFATTTFSRHASWPMSQNCTDAMTKTPRKTEDLVAFAMTSTSQIPFDCAAIKPSTRHSYVEGCSARELKGY